MMSHNIFKLAAAALFVALSASCVSAQNSTIDFQVLNFALNLEYLEANFYSCAVFGKPISQSLWGVGGVAPIGCKKAVFVDKFVASLAAEIAQDEIAHVAFLRSVLGSLAVPQPKIDIGPAFVAAANAALSLYYKKNTVGVPAFSPYDSDINFLLGAFLFEDVGSTAYTGAAALIENKDYLTAAAKILGVESYHAGAVRNLLYKVNSLNSYLQSPEQLRVSTVAQIFSDLRDAVDGPTDIDQGVVTGEACNSVPTDSSSLIYARDTSQVLSIVYLGGTSSGGFFPNGLNGDIKTV